MKKVAVLFGGSGNEYEVSLESMASLMEHFPSDEFELVPVAIDKQLHWFVGDFTIDDVVGDKWIQSAEEVVLQMGGSLRYVNKQESIKIDLFFSLIHGTFGEDGKLQAYLTMNQCRFVGSDYVSSAMGFDKELTHRIMAQAGIDMVDYLCVRKTDNFSFETIVEKLGLPFIIKPAREGSSYGIHVVTDKTEFDAAMADAFTFDTKLVLETFIDGVEIGSSIIEYDNDYILGVPDEIECHKTFFDYQAKYEFEETKIHCPARITEANVEKIKALTIAVFKGLECSGYARVDFFLTSDHQIVLNEINTVPGFTSHSRFPTMMKTAGYDFKEVIRLILKEALKSNV